MPQPETQPQGSQATGQDGDSKQAGGSQTPPIKLTEVETLEMNLVGGQDAIVKKIDQQAEKLTQDIQLVGFNYSWRGLCKRCGWQTMQFDQKQAHDLVKRHALKHWRELIAEAAQGAQQQQQGQQQQHAPGQQTGSTSPQQAQRQQPAR